MNAAQLALWRKIEAFQVNQPGTRFTFEDRLARENRWTPEFARRVVGEYKRFLLLAMLAEHPVTPSDEVDQAWHLHMVYTRSYWEELCGGVLPRPLHHGPTRGGRAEDTKFTNLYERTLATYRAVFGQEAPADIWPVTATRFGRAPSFQRINTSENWIVPKPRLTPGRVVGAGAALVAVGMAGCGVALGSGGGILGAGTSANALTIGLIAVAVVVTLGLVLSGLRRASRSGSAGRSNRADASSGCSPGFVWWMMPGSASDPKDANHNGIPDSQEGGAHGSDASSGSDSSGSGCSSSGCSGSGCGGGGCGS
jgi:hypothetical protein